MLNRSVTLSVMSQRTCIVAQAFAPTIFTWLLGEKNVAGQQQLKGDSLWYSACFICTWYQEHSTKCSQASLKIIPPLRRSKTRTFLGGSRTDEQKTDVPPRRFTGIGPAHGRLRQQQRGLLK